MTRFGRFLGGVTVGYVNMAAVMLGGLLLTPFFLERLGQRDYGLWLVGLQILAYLALMDFGVVALLGRATAYATGRAGGIDKATDLPDVIGQTVRLVLWQVPLVAGVAGGVWLFMPAAWSPLQVPVGLVLIAFVVMFPVRALRAVLEGLQDLTFLGRVQLGTWLAGILVTVVAIVGGRGLLSLALGWVVSQILAGACWAYRLRQRFPGIFPTRLPPFSAAAARRQLGQGFWVTVSQVAHALLAGTDVFIIGILAGPAAVVPFVCTGKLISVLTNHPHLLMRAAGPALSEMRMGEPKARLFQVSSALTQAMLMASGAVACVVLAVNHGFVIWWVGADQYAGLPLTVLLLLVMLLRHWNTTTVYTLFAFGRERRLALTALMDGLVTVGGSVWLVGQLGLIGAPLASLAGVVLVSLPINLSAVSQETGATALAWMRQLWPWFWRFSLLAAGARVVAILVFSDTFLRLTGIVAALLLIYGVIMLRVALRSPMSVYLEPNLSAARARWVKPLLARLTKSGV